MKTHSPIYNVVVIGGGVSGTALLYTLAHYTDLSRLALLEKYPAVGQVNSNAKNNSQTLHVGDIETNYTIDKVKSVKPAAMMVAHYAQALDPVRRDAILKKTQKMILAVGASEVAKLEKRFRDLKPLFPELQKLSSGEIARVEPAVMEGRDPHEPVLALFNPDGFAVNFEKLAQSFIVEARNVKGKTIDIQLGNPAQRITKNSDGTYTITTPNGAVHAEVVVVDTDAYSLGFAKAMGYGQEFSLIPIAGTFYFTKQLLRGKVYTMQEPRLPFAAAHGDPDINVPDKTRWGPTARFFPVLESRKLRTSAPYFASSGLGKLRTWKSFTKILFEPVRFWYLLKNMLYAVPFVGKYFFVGNIQKIVPSVRARDLSVAHGFGGMRLQRVDTRTHELLLGEGKIIGDNIIFNMTPSPGASVCLYNGMRDAEQIMKFFEGSYTFEKARMMSELVHEGHTMETTDVSLRHSYSS